MKILNVMLTTRLGGLEQAFIDYNEAITLAGYQVIPVVHTKSPLVPLDINKYHKINNFSKYDLVALLKLYIIVITEKPDLIITHGNRAHYMMKKIAGKIPVIGVLHTFSFKHIIKCDYVISVSTKMMEGLTSKGYPLSKCFHIPNMIRVANECHYKPSISATIPVMGVMTRIVKAKAVDVFIKALSLLKKKNIAFKAKIAGDGDQFDNIKKLIAELDLEQNIQTLGWVEDKESFYSEIDILCLPSREEPFGIVILEGFLHSKPIIVSDVSGPMEIVENNKDALVFESENHTELAELLEKLIVNNQLMQTLAENGFNKVKFYDINLISKKLSSLLVELHDKKTS